MMVTPATLLQIETPRQFHIVKRQSTPVTPTGAGLDDHRGSLPPWGSMAGNPLTVRVASDAVRLGDHGLCPMPG